MFVNLSYNKKRNQELMGFKIYSSTHDSSNMGLVSISKALESLSADRVCGLVFCGTSDTVEYHQLLNDIKSTVYNVLGVMVPVTLIPQYLLPDGGLSMDVYTLEGEAEISIAEKNGVCYGLIENSEESLLFIEGVPSSDFSKGVKEQSEEVFGKIDALLSLHDFAVDDIVRQWNYIGNIVSYRDGKQNYQEFNDARTIYYSQGQWQYGYPAATGIGASGEGIIVGCIAFKSKNSYRRAIYPIDNPLQVAAHAYSKQVLIYRTEESMKSTPKFERAKLIKTQRGVCCFVSGTAAIRGEQSAAISTAKEQAIMTIENIKYLVSPENLQRHFCKPYNLKYAQLQVFIKNAQDYAEVRSVVEQAYPQMSVVYTIADVCRSELLVEIEGILMS